MAKTPKTKGPPPEPEFPSFSEAAGSVYLVLALEQLAEERSRKESIERRAMWHVGTGGTFIVFLFGVLRVTGGNPETANHDLKALIVWALVAFAFAMALALRATFPALYAEVTTQSIEGRLVHEYWPAPSLAAARHVTMTYIRTLDSARTVNGLKAGLLRLAGWVQFVGMWLLALAAIAVAGGA